MSVLKLEQPRHLLIAPREWPRSWHDKLSAARRWQLHLHTDIVELLAPTLAAAYAAGEGATPEWSSPGSDRAGEGARRPAGAASAESYLRSSCRACCRLGPPEGELGVALRGRDCRLCPKPARRV